MPLLELDKATYGYAITEGYAHGRGPSFDAVPSYAGPTRYRLKDDFPTYVMDVTYDWDNETYNSFQSFHRSIRYGADRFRASLLMTSEFGILEDTVVVQMQSMWQANLVAADHWKVTLRLELPFGTNLTGTFCDVIYGGPISALAPDEIYAGEPDALPPDIIAPCEAIDPARLVP